MQQEKIIKIVGILFVICALAGYIYCSVNTMWEGINAIGDKYVPQTNTALAYFSTGLAGLVGGIVAVAFGLPKPGTARGGPVTLMENVGEQFNSIGTLATTSKSDAVKKFLGGSYIITYALLGIIAIAVWVYISGEEVNAIKRLSEIEEPKKLIPKEIANLSAAIKSSIKAVGTMATAFFGLALPIVLRFFQSL